MTSNHRVVPLLELQGTIIKYDENKKFGFIRTINDGNEVFFHIKQYIPKQKPKIGKMVFFNIKRDEKGRFFAINIKEHQTKEIKKEPTLTPKRNTHNNRNEINTKKEKQADRKQKDKDLNIICGYGAFMLLLYVIGALFFHKPKFFVSWHLFWGCVSFGAYWLDKYRAENNRWRIRENTLHLFDFLGGWIGGAFAQKFLHHKTIKDKFRDKFKLTVIFQPILLIIIYEIIKRIF